MPGGRPTSYSQEIADAAWAYVHGGWEEAGHAMPSIVGMCKVLNRGQSTLYDWAKEENNEFSDILKACMEEQQLVLLNNGLKGNYNAAITKLALGKHGYHERQEHTGADGKPIEIRDKSQEEIDQRIAELTAINEQRKD